MMRFRLDDSSLVIRYNEQEEIEPENREDYDQSSRKTAEPNLRHNDGRDKAMVRGYWDGIF